MPTLTITKTYQDGNVLTEADLDNIKDSIETFINVTKLDDDNLQDNGISSDKFTVSTRALLVPTGCILDYGGVTAPSGYLLCYGQEISQSTYADLFTAIGTTWNTGGEIAGNFRLPDLRGRSLFGKDNMGGSSANRITTPDGDVLGTTGGAQSVTLTTAELPAHDHTFTNGAHTHSFSATTSSDGAHTHTVDVGTNAGPFENFFIAQGKSPNTTSHTSSSNGAHTHTLSGTTGSGTGSGTTASTGSGTAFSNLPPLAITNKIIKT